MNTSTNTVDVEAEETEAEDTSKQVIIEVPNPSKEEMEKLLEGLRVNYDHNVVVKPFRFTYKKTTDKASGIETIRKPVDLPIRYPSVEGIVSILREGGKGLDLLIDAVESIVNAAARDILAEDTTLNATNFPLDKLSWNAIAEIPKAQRRGGGISKETWEAFQEDYCEIMPEATGKTLQQVANAAKIFVQRLSTVKTNMTVLAVLIEQLAVYAEASPNIEEFQEVVSFLLDKADTYMNMSPEELLANL